MHCMGEIRFFAVFSHPQVPNVEKCQHWTHAQEKEPGISRAEVCAEVKEEPNTGKEKGDGCEMEGA